MITVRKASERGHNNIGWLDSFHTFSFGEYQDLNHMKFRSLRVINEDRVRPGKGFGTHSHRDMEIISYVVQGTLAHKDSMGSVSELRTGDVQVMSAGTGVTHSEFNASDKDLLHFLQIWILPERQGVEPRYEEKHFSCEEKRGKLLPIASPNGERGSLRIGQDATLFGAVLEPEENISHAFSSGRYGWLQIVQGRVELGGKELEAGDGAAVSDETVLNIRAKESSVFLLFDLA